MHIIHYESLACDQRTFGGSLSAISSDFCEPSKEQPSVFVRFAKLCLEPQFYPQVVYYTLLLSRRLLEERLMIRLLGEKPTGWCRFASTRPLARNHGMQRCFSFKITVPPPTWSVKSLQLDESHNLVSEELLTKLSRRALIDLKRLDPDRRQELRQDLGNMLHLIDQVQQNASNLDDEDLTDVDLYDKSRGVTEILLRSDTQPSAEEQEEAQAVYQTMLEHKTTMVGAHAYFEVVTGQSNDDNN